MKKMTRSRKLEIKKEALRNLDAAEQAQVVGGMPGTTTELGDLVDSIVAC